jgi:hypothetical protein
MKNFNKLFLLLIPIVVFSFFVVGSALAAEDTAQLYTNWAGKDGASGQGGIYNQGTTLGPTQPLTAIGVGGNNINQCSLRIKSAPVVNGYVNFNNLDNNGNWQSPKNCPNGGAGGSEQAADYTTNSVVSGWNYAVTSNINTPVCYYENYNSLDNLNSSNEYFSCGGQLSSLLSYTIISAPSGSVITAIGISVEPGTVSGLAVKRINLTPPPTVAEIDGTPISQNISTETNKILNLYISNADPVQGQSYSLTLDNNAGGVYIPNIPGNWSDGQFISDFDSGSFSAFSPGSSMVIDPRSLKLAFKTTGLKKMKVTHGGYETNFTVSVSQPSASADWLSCTVSPGSAQVGEAVTATAYGTNLDRGYFDWSSPEGANPVHEKSVPFVFDSDGQKEITLSHSLEGKTLTTSCGVYITPSYSAPTCQAVAPAEDERFVNKSVIFSATGGNGTYSWRASDGSITSAGSSAIGTFNLIGDKIITVTSAGMEGNCETTILPPPPIKQPSCKVVPAPGETNIVRKILAQRGIGKVGETVYIQGYEGDKTTYNWSKKISVDNSFTISPLVSDLLTTIVANTFGLPQVRVSSGGKTNTCSAIIIGGSSPVVSEPDQTPPLSCNLTFDGPLSEQKPGAIIDAKASGGSGAYAWEVATPPGTIIPDSSDPSSAIAVFQNSEINTARVLSGGVAAECSIFLAESGDEPIDEPAIEEFPNVTCSPSLTNLEVGDSKTFTAGGGNGNYSWDAPAGAHIVSSSGNSATIRFNSSGNGKIVEVNSVGDSALPPCVVNVSRSAPTVNIWTEPANEINLPVMDYTLRWNSTDADSCSISGSWDQSVGTSGFQPFTNGRGTYSYAINCQNESGSASDSVSISVKEIPSCSFVANPSKIVPPQKSILTWSCERVSRGCSLDGVSVDTGGSKDVSPQRTTTYVLNCSGADGSRDFPATVTIDFIPWFREIIPIWN